MDDEVTEVVSFSYSWPPGLGLLNSMPWVCLGDTCASIVGFPFVNNSSLRAW